MLAALERIGEQSEGAEVLVIARRNTELEMPPEGWSKATGINRKVINARARHRGIDSASTRHHLPRESVVARYENDERVVLRTDRQHKFNNDHIVCGPVDGGVSCRFAEPAHP